MSTKTYLERIALADVADYFADGTKAPALMIADTLFTEGARVDDVTSYRDGYQVHTIDKFDRRDQVFYTHDADEWFVTTDLDLARRGL